MPCEDWPSTDLPFTRCHINDIIGELNARIDETNASCSLSIAHFEEAVDGDLFCKRFVQGVKEKVNEYRSSGDCAAFAWTNEPGTELLDCKLDINEIREAVCMSCSCSGCYKVEPEDEPAYIDYLEQYTLDRIAGGGLLILNIADSRFEYTDVDDNLIIFTEIVPVSCTHEDAIGANCQMDLDWSNGEVTVTYTLNLDSGDEFYNPSEEVVANAITAGFDLAISFSGGDCGS